MLAVRIIAVGDRVGPVRGSRELSSLLPGEGPVIPVVYGVPRVIISDRLVIILRQLVLPVGIAVGINLYCTFRPLKGYRRSDRSTPSLSGGSRPGHNCR